MHSGPESTRHEINVFVSPHDLEDTCLPAFRAAPVEDCVEGYARVAIAGTGPAIPAAELELVFQAFYWVEGSRNRDTGGTGHGLASARAVARAHDGDIVLTNRPGTGLIDLVSLPPSDRRLGQRYERSRGVQVAASERFDGSLPVSDSHSGKRRRGVSR